MAEAQAGTPYDVRPLGPTPTAAKPDLPVRKRRAAARNYWLFALPAVLATAAVIVFPWLFTIFMSVQEWNVSGTFVFSGLDNYNTLLRDGRFLDAVGTTLLFTALAVVFPIVLGTLAALAFHENFPWRGL
ncbi:MAG: carbohydrate ABC transporter permease, partial [Hyphomicrobiaceae bacterium]